MPCHHCGNRFRQTFPGIFFLVGLALVATAIALHIWTDTFWPWVLLCVIASFILPQSLVALSDRWRTPCPRCKHPTDGRTGTVFSYGQFHLGSIACAAVLGLVPLCVMMYLGGWGWGRIAAAVLIFTLVTGVGSQFRIVTYVDRSSGDLVIESRFAKHVRRVTRYPVSQIEDVVIRQNGDAESWVDIIIAGSAKASIDCMSWRECEQLKAEIESLMTRRKETPAGAFATRT